MKPPDPEVPYGTLDMMVLKTLTRGTLHGYAVVQLLKQFVAIPGHAEATLHHIF